MKQITIFFLFLFITGVSFAQPAKHVIIISIDGFRPDFYRDASWAAVNLQQLTQNGASADGVRGVFPTVTYPSHTTVMTGVMPAKHGIYYNTPFETNGQTGRWYWEYDSIKVPTLWSAVKAAGLSSACVGWPVTVGAPINYNLPEIWTLAKDGEHAKLDATSKASNPQGLFEEVQQYATGKLEADDYNNDYFSGDENAARISSYLIRKYKPSLLAVHLACTDHFEHAEGRDGKMVRLAVASADRAVRTILEAIDKAGIKDSTTVIVLGDHGFVDTHSSLAPNVWLSKAGLLTDIPSGNWKARFHTSGGAAFLQLKDKNDKKILEAVKQLLATVPEQYKKLFRVISKEQLTMIGADPNASLALSAEQGIAFNPSEKGEILKATKGGTHGYFPDFKEIQTGFIASGAGIKKEVVIPYMGLEDVSPLVSYLLGISFPTAEGTLYPGILVEKKKNN